MARILNKNAFLVALLPLALAAYLTLFESQSGAVELHQAPRLAAGNTRNSSSPVNSLPRSPSTADGDVQIVLTTNERGNSFSRIIATVANPTAITTESGSAPMPMQPVAAGDIVFGQIYGSGGNPGSTFQNNYLELFNRTNNVIDISGWPIYIATATETFSQSIAFVSSRGIGIGAHRYLLIRFGPNSTNGAPLPNPDFTVPSDPIIIPGFPPIPPINLSPSGKVFLTGPGTTLFGSTCPLPNSSIVDFVGYGSTANCFEGTGPTATINNTTAALRKNGGLIDTDDNANDFAGRPPTPLNSSNRPIDDAEFFVRQHYSDFLNRQPDQSGLSFWIDQIISCGIDQPCNDVKHINVSGAFFLSIEFQQTGYLAYRTYKAAYGDLTGAPVPLRLDEFQPDMQMISQGVVVNAPGWELLLENNKQAFFLDFVSRLRFRNAYTTTLSPADFVDALFMKAAVTPSATERSAAISEFGSVAETSDMAARARALRLVAENGTLGAQEKNRAFVLMQYFGYLRRNPNDPPESGLNFAGYNFWLAKLNQFNGNFVNAEMVKAFITSGEYRQRF